MEWGRMRVFRQPPRLCVAIWAFLVACLVLPPLLGLANVHQGASVYRLPPEKRGGQAYRLEYLVDAPIEVFWRFKTDFDNEFLVTNKYIEQHRLISRWDNVVLTKDRYAFIRSADFLWQTTIYPARYRLEFVLLNPEECRQRFHYGHIQLEAAGQKTKVTQMAYFDFFGASVWAVFPWHGMRHFLRYTAQWEQETIVRLKAHYANTQEE